MSLNHFHVRTGLLLVLILAVDACTFVGTSKPAGPRSEIALDRAETAAAKVQQQSIGDLPYHSLVYHLDLSILAYQLYSQSLVWPFDPYYEDLNNLNGSHSSEKPRRVFSWVGLYRGEVRGLRQEAWRRWKMK